MFACNAYVTSRLYAGVGAAATAIVCSGGSLRRPKVLVQIRRPFVAVTFVVVVTLWCQPYEQQGAINAPSVLADGVPAQASVANF